MEELTWMRNTIYLTTSFLALLHGHTLADVNQVMGWSCSGPKNPTLDSQYQAQLDTLLESLANQAPTRGGFYQNDVGKHDKWRLYGLVQCRGDIPMKSCESCIRNATWVLADKGCGVSESMVWMRWCFLKYSNQSFFGTWDGRGIAEAKETTPFEDPEVVSRGVELMNELASTAPRRESMFETRVIDVGPKSGKRYGMAQCTRDVGAKGCAECLAGQLATFRTTIGNKRGWEIYGSSCSLWYHDYHFYFINSTSVPAVNEGIRSYRGFGLCNILYWSIALWMIVMFN